MSSPAEQTRGLLRLATLAPSTHNTQPWRFRVVPGAIEVWADRQRHLPRIDPDGRQLVMSCGAALFHLRLGLRQAGIRDDVDYGPYPSRPDLVARLRRGSSLRPALRDLELFHEIPRRHTNRADFAPRPVSADLGERLVREAAIEGAWLMRLHPHDKLDVAGAISEGDRRQLGDPAYRRELARWLVARGSLRRDGIPMARKDVVTALPLLGPALVRAIDRRAAVASREAWLATASPMLAVLGTDHDQPRDWITAGEAMEAVLLRASQLGLAVSFLNQPIEEPSLRARIQAAARHAGHAQLVLRFGWAAATTATPRRRVDDVMAA